MKMVYVVPLVAVMLYPTSAHALTSAEQAELARLASAADNAFCRMLSDLKENTPAGDMNAEVAAVELNGIIQSAPSSIRSEFLAVASTLIGLGAASKAYSWADNHSPVSGGVWPYMLAFEVASSGVPLNPDYKYGPVLDSGYIRTRTPMEDFLERLEDNWEEPQDTGRRFFADRIGVFDGCDPEALADLLEHLPDEQGPLGDPDGGVGEEGTGPMGGWRPFDLDAWKNSGTVEISDPFDTEQIPNAMKADLLVEMILPVSEGLCWGVRQEWDHEAQAWDPDTYEVFISECMTR